MSITNKSFSKDEITKMISTTKYKIKKGDTLSLLVIKFKNSFPSLKSVDSGTLENKIYNENKLNAFNKSKEVLLEGKELTLKFICDYRASNLRIVSNIKEYIFTDEDKLAFNILKGDKAFWVVYKDLAPYMQGQFKKIGKTTLPEKMALNTKLSGTVIHKKLVEFLKAKFPQVVVVTVEELVEEIFKLLEKKTVTAQEKQDLTKKLEAENTLKRTDKNSSAVIPKSQIEKLSTKCVEEYYCKTPLTSEQKKNIEKNVYKVTKSDIVMGPSNLLKPKILNTYKDARLFVKDKEFTNAVIFLENQMIDFINPKKLVKKPFTDKESLNMKNGIFQVTYLDNLFLIASIDDFWTRLINNSGLSKEEFHNIRKMLGLKRDVESVKKELQGHKNNLFFPSSKTKGLFTTKTREDKWKIMLDFWNNNKTLQGDIKTFEKYWNTSHNLIETYENIPLPAKKVELCDILYVIHYMAQGAYNKEYAKKIVWMTNSVVLDSLNPNTYITCEKDDSRKTLISPESLYLFKSIDPKAQTKFIEMIREVKNEMMWNFTPIIVTSGKRGALEHSVSGFRGLLLEDKGVGLSVYAGKTGMYFILMKDKYYGNIIEEVEEGKEDKEKKNRWKYFHRNSEILSITIPSDDRILIEDITKGDLKRAIEVCKQLMKQGSIEGSDHTANEALDIARTTSAENLYNKATEVYFTYAKSTFYHIDLDRSPIIK